MISVIILALAFHFIINQFQYLINKKVVFYFFGTILSSVLIYFLYRITYTADFSMYESFYKWEYDEVDPLFYYAALYFKDNNYGFQNLFSAHILIISFLYSIFIVKLDKNLFYIFGIYVLILFIPYVNQIRYFLAFSSFLLAAYYLIYNRKIPLFIFFTVLSVISHSAIIILFTFFPFYFFVSEKYYKNLFRYSSVILFVISYIVSSSSLYLLLDHFGEYIKNENQSSILGGIFNTLPMLTILIPLYFLDKNYKGDRSNLKYQFLKKLSYYTVVLIPASVFVQIIGFRYVLPFVIVWIMFFLFLIEEKSFFVKTRYFFISYILIIVILFLQYHLSLMLFGESVLLNELDETINSIKNY